MSLARVECSYLSGVCIPRGVPVGSLPRHLALNPHACVWKKISRFTMGTGT